MYIYVFKAYNSTSEEKPSALSHLYYCRSDHLQQIRKDLLNSTSTGMHNNTWLLYCTTASGCDPPSLPGKRGICSGARCGLSLPVPPCGSGHEGLAVTGTEDGPPQGVSDPQHTA